VGRDQYEDDTERLKESAEFDKLAKAAGATDDEIRRLAEKAVEDMLNNGRKDQQHHQPFATTTAAKGERRRGHHHAGPVGSGNDELGGGGAFGPPALHFHDTGHELAGLPLVETSMHPATKADSMNPVERYLDLF
jgi:hypothetical protein